MGLLITYLKQGLDKGQMSFAAELLSRHFSGVQVFESKQELQSVIKAAVADCQAVAAYTVALALQNRQVTEEEIGFSYEALLEIGARENHVRSKLALAIHLLATAPNQLSRITQLLREVASSGDARGQFYLSCYRAFDSHVPYHPAVLIIQLRQKSGMGNTEASFALALASQFGIEVQKDLQVAEQYYKKCRATPEVCYYRHLLLQAMGESESTDEFRFGLLNKAAEAGHDLACMKLMRMQSLAGCGTDYPRRLCEHITSAIAVGNSDAVELVGYDPGETFVEMGLGGFGLSQWRRYLMHSAGNIFADDIYRMRMDTEDESLQAELDKLLEIAAEAGSSDAAVNLGLIKLDESWEDAIPWLALAHCDGDLTGTHALAAELVKRGRTNEERMFGLELLQTAAESDHAFAHYELSGVFGNGLVGPRNPDAFARHLNEAAALGSARAQREVGLRQKYGDEVVADETSSEYWMRQYTDSCPRSEFYAASSQPHYIRAKGAEVIDIQQRLKKTQSREKGAS